MIFQAVQLRTQVFEKYQGGPLRCSVCRSPLDRLALLHIDRRMLSSDRRECLRPNWGQLELCLIVF